MPSGVKSAEKRLLLAFRVFEFTVSCLCLYSYPVAFHHKCLTESVHWETSPNTWPFPHQANSDFKPVSLRSAWLPSDEHDFSFDSDFLSRFLPYDVSGNSSSPTSPLDWAIQIKTLNIRICIFQCSCFATASVVKKHNRNEIESNWSNAVCKTISYEARWLIRILLMEGEGYLRWVRSAKQKKQLNNKSKNKTSQKTKIKSQQTK